MMNKPQFDKIRAMLKRDGQLTASGFVAEAAKQGSVLSTLFEWDDTKAGIEYRLAQARKYLRTINVRIEKNGEEIYHVPPINVEGNRTRGEGVYKEARVIVKDVDEFDASLGDLLRQIGAIERSANKLIEVATGNAQGNTKALTLVVKHLRNASNALRRAKKKP